MADSFGETALLRAVHNRIVTHADGLDDNHVHIVPTEQHVPPTIRHRNVLVMSGGVTPGPRHNPSGHVWDELFSVRVVCIVETAKVPLDRQYKKFIDTLESVNAFLGEIRDALDFKYGVTTDAEAILAEIVGGTIEGFVRPLTWAATDPNVTPVSKDMFNSSSVRPERGVSPAPGGLMRGMTYSGANRIQTITSNYS